MKIPWCDEKKNYWRRKLCDFRDGQSFTLASIHSFIIDDDMHIDPFIIIYFPIVTHFRSLFLHWKASYWSTCDFHEGCFLNLTILKKKVLSLKIYSRLKLSQRLICDTTTLSRNHGSKHSTCYAWIILKLIKIADKF